MSLSSTRDDSARSKAAIPDLICVPSTSPSLPPLSRVLIDGGDGGSRSWSSGGTAVWITIRAFSWRLKPMDLFFGDRKKKRVLSGQISTEKNGQNKTRYPKDGQLLNSAQTKTKRTQHNKAPKKTVKFTRFSKSKPTNKQISKADVDKTYPHHRYHRHPNYWPTPPVPLI